jgi:hypothetical protein
MFHKDDELRDALALARLVIEEDHKRLCEGRNYLCTCGYDDEVLKAAEKVSALSGVAGDGG